MAKKRNRRLTTTKKGKGKFGGKWGHNFTPKNAVARQLKKKTYKTKGKKSRARKGN